MWNDIIYIFYIFQYPELLHISLGFKTVYDKKKDQLSLIALRKLQKKEGRSALNELNSFLMEVFGSLEMVLTSPTSPMMLISHKVGGQEY